MDRLIEKGSAEELLKANQEVRGSEVKSEAIF